MIKRLAVMLTTLIMCLTMLSMNAFAANTNNKDYIEVTGFGVGPKNANIRSSFYKTYARQAARLDALRQLMEAIQGVTIYTDSDLWADDQIRTKINGIVINAKQVGKAKFNDDGFCEVTMRMSLPKNE